MKNLAAYTILAVFSLTLALNTSAQETKKVNDEKHRINIKVNQESMVVFRADLLEGQKRLNYVLSVYNEKGDMVYGATFLRKNPIYKSYDLSQLPKGEYTFEVTRGMKPVYSKTILNKQIEEGQTEPLVVEKL